MSWISALQYVRPACIIACLGQRIMTASRLRLANELKHWRVRCRRNRPNQHLGCSVIMRYSLQHQVESWSEPRSEFALPALCIDILTSLQGPQHLLSFYRVPRYSQCTRPLVFADFPFNRLLQRLARIGRKRPQSVPEAASLRQGLHCPAAGGPQA